MESPHQRLGVLVGRWRTEGSTKAAADAPAARIDALDTYEWLPGRFGLLHVVDARVGDQHVEGAEIIGWDPARDAYVTSTSGATARTPTRRASPTRTARSSGR